MSSLVLLSAAAALLSACGANYEDGSSEETWQASDSEDGAAADDELVLGTTKQGLTYPYCVSAASDPDGDGWGWENNQSCIVNKTTSYPYCVSAASDPDGDGWGWENNQSCIVNKTTTTTTTGTMTCSNPDGTNSVMAAFAVAVAQELGRWNASKDFVLANTNGYTENSTGTAQTVKLASGSDANGPIGKSRCADGKCAKVQALLDMQYDQANNLVYVQGSGSTKILLNPGALRSRMSAKLLDQIGCDRNAKDGDVNSCTTEQNALTYVSAAKGGCDTNFTFAVKNKAGTALKYPSQLKNQLRFADSTNPYVNFQNLGNGNISIDPTYGLDEDGSTTTGTCTAACTKISLTSLAGSCCSCGGVTKTFVKSPYSAITYLCQ
jgi:hypothetical protein